MWGTAGLDRDLANLVRQKKGNKTRKGYVPQDEGVLSDVTFTTLAVHPPSAVHAWPQEGGYGLKHP